MHAHIRIGAINIRPAAERFAETVADRILDAQGGEIEARQRALLRRYVHAQRTLHREQAQPVHPARSFVNVLLARIVELGDAPEDPRSQARPEIRQVANAPVSRERDAARNLFHTLRAQRRELGGKQRLQAARGRRKEMFHRLSVRTIDAGRRAARG